MVNVDLDFWLKHIRSVHKDLIDYSLVRIKIVAERLQVLHFDLPVITITGTNGKGSTVSALEAILLASGHQVASFTSPFLLNFNEQIRINGCSVSDSQLIEAFAKIEAAREGISLSEFEFTTLAALLIFKSAALDIILLEVGLGGSNDAVNIIDANLTIVTSLALDHEEFLGSTIDLIAATEAHLFRAGKKALIGVKNAPPSLISHAEAIQCKLYTLAHDFGFLETADTWRFWNTSIQFENLIKPNILCKNAALAIEALLLLEFSFSQEQLQTALKDINIQGRLQYIPSQPSYLLDVAHNIEAITQLIEFLKIHKPLHGKVIAVFSMLKDKKISTIIDMLKEYIDVWSIGVIDHPRAASQNQLIDAFQKAHINENSLSINQTVDQALSQAKSLANPQDLILVFGSFHVVRAGLQQ